MEYLVLGFFTGISLILDIGASLGISSLGFIKLGFKNKIYAFEPNYILYKKYLTKNLKKYKNINTKNIALGSTNGTKTMYMPFYNSFTGRYDKKVNPKFGGFSHEINIYIILWLSSSIPISFKHCFVIIKYLESYSFSFSNRSVVYFKTYIPHHVGLWNIIKSSAYIWH